MALEIPTEEELLDVIDRAERIIEDAAVDTILSLQRAVENFASRLKGLLAEAFDDPRALPKLEEAVALADQLADALNEAGLGDVMATYTQGFRAVEAEATAYFGVFGIEDSRAGLDIDSLNAFVSFQEQNFLNLADRRLLAPVRDAVINGVVGGRPRQVVLGEITEVIRELGILTRAERPFTDVQIETLVNDSFRRHYRQTKAEKADSLGMDVIWYQGPDDKITRPACKAMLRNGRHGVPNMWLKSEFNTSIHPALREPPIVAGGGFNCRHTVTPITLGFAESKGFKAPKSVQGDEQVEENAEEL